MATGEISVCLHRLLIHTFDCNGCRHNIVKLSNSFKHYCIIIWTLRLPLRYIEQMRLTGARGISAYIAKHICIWACVCESVCFSICISGSASVGALHASLRRLSCQSQLADKLLSDSTDVLTSARTSFHLYVRLPIPLLVRDSLKWLTLFQVKTYEKYM